MKYPKLVGWMVGVSLAGALASADCGGDDTAAPGGTAGNGGASAMGGTAGQGGSATTGSAGSAGTAGTGGTAGSAGTGGAAGTGGGTAGTAGTAGTGTDAGDADASDAPAVAFSAVTAIFEMKCAACHSASDAAVQARIDLITSVGRYARLTTPLPNNQEGRCGFPVVEAGADAGDASSGDSGVLSNRQAIVPGDVPNSFLYAKVTGTQPMGNPPAGCGLQMPRKNVTGADGGPAGSVGCDQADGGAATNCLTQAELDTIRNWIQQGAPNN